MDMLKLRVKLKLKVNVNMKAKVKGKRMELDVCDVILRDWKADMEVSESCELMTTFSDVVL